MYSGSGLHLRSQLIGGKHPWSWVYLTTDSIVTVCGSGYFSDGADRGIAAGDQIYVVKTDDTPVSVKLVKATSTTSVEAELNESNLLDANGNEVIILGSTASAVNEVTITNKATGASPVISASGGDTNVGLRLDAKGTAYVGLNDPLVINTGTVLSDSTAGAVTYTAAQCLNGIIVRDPNGAGRTDVLPTAALLVAAIPGAAVGDTVCFKVINGADLAETITISAGLGGAFDSLQIAATRIIPQNTSRDILIRLTNVTAGSEAYVAYM